MSAAANTNGGCGKTLLYLLLGGAGLWVSWHALQWLYYALSYVGANTLLALDLSVYGQVSASHWPGYVLLGMGVGAAGGAIAAQRRFGLARAVAVGGWLAILLLLGIIYATVATDAPTETSSTVAEPLPARTANAAATATRPAANHEPVAENSAPLLDTSSVAAEGWQQVIVRAAPLRTSWADSLASPVAYLHEGDTVQLRRRAHTWVQVARGTTSPGAGVGWVRTAGLGPLAEEAAAEPTAAVVEPAPAASERLIKPTKKAETAAQDNFPDTASAASEAPRPLGHQQRTGQVGDQPVTYTLDWQPNGELSGSYYYNQQPGKLYRLTGALTAGGELHLLEFTRGRQSARGVLQRQGSGYVGRLLNTDGRQFSMSLE